MSKVTLADIVDWKVAHTGENPKVIPMNLLSEIGGNIIEGKMTKVDELTRAALEAGISPQKILDEGLIAAMAVVGERFQRNEIYVPEVLLSARAMHAGMNVLEPALLRGGGMKTIGTVVLGTVEGDIHDIGKNLVGIMLRGAGFEVNDLGVNNSAPKFIDAAKEKGAQLVCMSALLTSSMPMMKVTIEALDAAGMKGKVKTMVGGAPVTQRYADFIGADGYAKNAASAVNKAKALLGLV